MAGPVLKALRERSEAAAQALRAQLAGMEAYLDRSDAPGEWTVRQVLCHLLFDPGWDPVPVLQRFREQDLLKIDVIPGRVTVTPERRRMTLAELIGALEHQQRVAFGYLEDLTDADLEQRRARIPLFKQLRGTEETPLSAFVAGLFDHHWRDHAGQLAKIRAAVGLPAVP